VIARFTRSAASPLVADASSPLDLVWPDGNAFITQPFANHNGGQVAFGSDNFLYIGMGDGGVGDDPGNRAQDLATLLGRILRIDVSVGDTDTQGYNVPADNPFVGAAGCGRAAGPCQGGPRG
jgi:glucose/arabinose dehydrogenase